MMNKPKTYTVAEVFNSTKLSFIFEFFCSKNPSFIIEDFAKILNKNIILTGDENQNPSYTNAILLKEYDGDRPRYQFKVGYQNYRDIPTFLNTILFWINENASLNYSTLMKVKIDYDNDLKTLTNISNMDVGKLILKLDENYIYKRFSEMKNHPHSMSIKKIFPYNMSVNVSNIVNIRTQFKFPVSPNYGVDLTEQTIGSLTFNYIGGPKYSEKPKEIFELLEYYILVTYQTLNTPEYTKSEVEELNRLTEEYRTFRRCYYNVNRFLETYKDIKVYIDLNNNKELIETQWFQIRDHVAKLILESGVKKCYFNWDTELGTFQIKDAEITDYISGFQILTSKIKGVVENCELWQSEVSNSLMNNVTLVNENKVVNSYLKSVRADQFNKISESYIVNNGEIINCKINNSVIKHAGIGNLAKLDECLVVHSKEKLYEPHKIGIRSEEIRDYKWIKSLRGPDYKDIGFANEYKDE